MSWITRMYLPAAEEGYRVLVEAEERLPVRSYPKRVGETSRRPLGPSVKVMLNQVGVDTSAGFDWDYLHAMWPAMASARTDWVRNKPNTKAAHDRAGWQRIVAAGAPPYLGIGFGEGQTKRSRDCMFGARFQLPPDVLLQQVVQSLDELADLVLAMGAIEPVRGATRSDD
ncbi:hypothetical protein GCM10023225_01710 [Kineococcus glutinatus]|uniref:Uncharacterized protein n=1 Tax=Kineococcus glutinatus TaxID=1070872 RepID=A0ABP9H4D8_9ACTN